MSAALVFVIHSVGVLDPAPVTVAQGSLYGEESALHYQATSFTVVLYVHHASPQCCEGHVVTLMGLIHTQTHTS